MTRCRSFRAIRMVNTIAADPTARQNAVEHDPMAPSTGVILGIAVCSQRMKDPKDGVVRDFFFCRPGDDVKITIPTAG